MIVAISVDPIKFIRLHVVDRIIAGRPCRNEAEPRKWAMVVVLVVTNVLKNLRKALKTSILSVPKRALTTNAKIIASACPFCMTMLSDGIKNKEQEDEVKVLDIAELIAKSKNLSLSNRFIDKQIEVTIFVTLANCYLELISNH